MKRPLIIGQAPARGNDGKPPFAGSSGARLAVLSGVGDSGDDLTSHFKLQNLLPYYAGKSGAKGDNFDFIKGRDRALEILADLQKREGDKGRWVLLMGKNVARCFGQRQTPYLVKFHLTKNCPAFVFPHPSGINQWWNTPANVAQAAAVLHMVLRDGR